MKAFPPYPTFPGEKYVPLSYKYTLADLEYTLIIMNEPVCVVEYMADGSSTNMYRQYLRNPQGFAFLRKFDMTAFPQPKDVIRNCIHYVSSSILMKNKHFISESPKKFLTVLAVPFGAALTVFIKYKSKDYMRVEGFNK